MSEGKAPSIREETDYTVVEGETIFGEDASISSDGKTHYYQNGKEIPNPFEPGGVFWRGQQQQQGRKANYE